MRSTGSQRRHVPTHLLVRKDKHQCSLASTTTKSLLERLTEHPVTTLPPPVITKPEAAELSQLMLRF